MNRFRLRQIWSSLCIAACLILLTSCQGLAASNAGTNSVALSSSSLNFGAVAIGSSKSLPETLLNSSSSPVTISSIRGTSTTFQLTGITLPLVIGAGQRVSFNGQFQPNSAGTTIATISLLGENGETYASLTAVGDATTAVQLEINPGSLSFGSTNVGGNQTSTVVLSNSGKTDITVLQAYLSGAGFTMSNLTLPLTIPAGAKLSFTVTFAPPATGSYNGIIAFLTNTALVDARRSVFQAQGSFENQAALRMSGVGVVPGVLSASPASLSFGNVAVGASTNLTGRLTNTGGTAVNISQESVSGSGFAISGLAVPMTLAPSQSASFSATFSPAAAGSASANLQVVSDASNSPVTISFSGVGLAAGALSPNPTSLSFGSVQIGNSKSLSGTLTNTGGSSLAISGASLAGSGFSLSGLSTPQTLSAGQSTSFTVTFDPASAGGASGSLTVSSNGSNPTVTIGFSGVGLTPGDLVPNPSSVSFGNVQVGSTSSQSVTLTNSGGTSVTISSASASGAGFSVGGLSLPLTLNSGQSASFTVAFAPANAGAISGNVTITSSGSNPSLTIPVSGSGTTQGSLTPNPSSLSFGNVTVGSSSSQSVTLTNSGGSSVTISAASATGTGFSVGGVSLPVTLNAGQTTSFTVKFAPGAAGSVSGNVTITSNGSNPNLALAVSGTGVTAGSLTPNPSTLSFANVTVGSTSSQTVTLTNSGGTSVTISAATVTAAGFSISGLSLPMTLSSGQSTSFTVAFAPSTAGGASGNVGVSSNGSNPNLSIPVSGTGVAQGTLGANPASLSFGSVQVGNSTNLSETLTNSGGSAITITAANLSSAAYSISGLTLPTTLNPSQSVTFTATFTPSAADSASGTLSIVSNASNPNLTIGFSGVGTASGQLSVSPASLSFGTVSVGSNSSLSGSLTATGAAVTVSSATIGGSEFALSGISLPVTIPAGTSASFTVTFAPSASGSASANLTFASNVSNSPTVQSLSGNGQTVSHSVGLSWGPSTGAVSYNVYRKLSSNSSYTQINSGDATTSYTDTSVTAGDTYDYVITAVNAEDQESGYSNMAQAVIPND